MTFEDEYQRRKKEFEMTPMMIIYIKEKCIAVVNTQDNIKKFKQWIKYMDKEDVNECSIIYIKEELYLDIVNG